MRKGIMLGTSAAAVLLLSNAFAAEDLKSGPQVGKKVDAFHPLNVTGAQAGKKACQV